MSKIKVSVATIGRMPKEFDRHKVKCWKSSVFEIVDEIESYTISRDTDGPDWSFTDASLETLLPDRFNGEFLIAIANVPLELNWYSRRLSANRIVFTFYEIMDFLKDENIPLENVVYRMLYAHVLLYMRSGNRIPTAEEPTNFTHDDTRGCIFDMNGIKTEVVHSCHNPIICSDCTERLSREKVSKETVIICKKEIMKIKKALVHRIADAIKMHPMWSLVISGVTTVVLGMVANRMYEALKGVS